MTEFNDTQTLANHAEAVGAAADSLDNLVGALSLPMPAQIHVDQLKRALPEIAAKLRAAYVGITGENPWAKHPF